MAPRQVVNHFPGSFSLGRKDNLWRNLSRMQRQHGREYDFFAKSYLFPVDREHFERDFEEGDVYIIKPPASAEGRGIRLMNRLDQAPKPTDAALVQRYIGEPYLIDGKKFDLRIYVAVTSFDPLRIYIFGEGLTRFATRDYEPCHTSKSIKNRYMHLTNYSVNKKSNQYVRNEGSEDDDVGSKWSMSALYRHLEASGADVPALRARIDDLIVKTIISVEHCVVSRCNAACSNRASCFELFGFDVLLDAELKPWLIEVNVACSLASSSPLDKHVKGLLMTDLLHMVGIVPYDRKQEQAIKSRQSRQSRLSSKALMRGDGAPPLKHRNVFELQTMPLSQLSEEDLEHIKIAEDEIRRCGHWRRLFPCADMQTRYLPLFEFPRWRNTILAKWMHQPDWNLLRGHLNTYVLDAAKSQFESEEYTGNQMYDVRLLNTLQKLDKIPRKQIQTQRRVAAPTNEVNRTTTSAEQRSTSHSPRPIRSAPVVSRDVSSHNGYLGKRDIRVDNTLSSIPRAPSRPITSAPNRCAKYVHASISKSNPSIRSVLAISPSEPRFLEPLIRPASSEPFQVQKRTIRAATEPAQNLRDISSMQGELGNNFDRVGDVVNLQVHGTGRDEWSKCANGGEVLKKRVLSSITVGNDSVWYSHRKGANSTMRGHVDAILSKKPMKSILVG